MNQKVSELKHINTERAMELVRISSSIRHMDSSRIGILRNLQGYAGKGEDKSANKSVAVIASKALTEQFDKLIKYLTEHSETKDVNCNSLSKISENIHKDVIDDIPSINLSFE